MPLTHDMTLDMGKRNGLPHPRVTVRVGDMETQAVRARLVSGGNPYAPTLPMARLDILHADGSWSRVSATVDGDTVGCVLPAEALGVAGLCRLAHFVLYDERSAESTEGFELRILEAVEPTGEQAGAYDDMLTQLWVKWDALEREAERSEAARVAAEESRAKAEMARKSAETKRQDAEKERDAAETERVARLGGGEPEPEPDAPDEYDPMRVYYPGDRCTFEGAVYEWVHYVQGNWSPRDYPAAWRPVP